MPSRPFSISRRGRLRFALALALAGLVQFGLAMPSAPQNVQDSQALNTALSRLAQNPLDPGALIEAGSAALAMGDAEAAIGFFTRANEVAPGNARAKAGLASAYVRNEDPFTAIRLFTEAEQAGQLYADAVVDRGLAYDLVGDNATAQRFYRMAGPSNDEALRRLALSLAISGDKRGSEAALAPLMARQDKSAWRVRAFALAILGEPVQAVSISNAMLPAGLAAAISPYLRYMGQLTKAQQAAAANLGHFPRASEIGRDDPRIAAYSRPVARPVASRADAGLIPAGEPLGKRTATRQTREERDTSRKRDRERKAGSERVRPPEPVVATTTTVAAVQPAPVTPRPVTTPAVRPTPTPIPTPAPAPASSALATTQAAQAPATPAAPQLALAAPARAVAPPTAAPARAVQGPSFELLPSTAAKPATSAVVSASAPVIAPAPAAAPAAAPPAPASLADAFSEFNRPTISTAPAPGAVDVRKITAARPAPKVTKPAPPAQPSRIWVQVATGRDKKALAFDWRKMTRENAAMFKGRKPYVTAWNQTNRLLTGPFESEAKASDFMNQLRKEDVAGAFLWTSPAGQVVDELGGAK